jgi:hypothetical protein
VTEEKTDAKSGSKFAGLLQAARRREESEPETVALPPDDSATATVPKAIRSSRTKTAPTTPAILIQETRRPGPGRPPGKRSDPAFTQVTAYIRGSTYRQIKLALLQDEGAAEREFSDLVEELLATWLKRNA